MIKASVKFTLSASVSVLSVILDGRYFAHEYLRKINVLGFWLLLLKLLLLGETDQS